MSRFFFRTMIVLMVFPMAGLILNTPFLIFAILLERAIPHPSRPVVIAEWTFFALSMVVVFGGAFYACWRMWPTAPKPVTHSN